ncbi:hypothetical protein OEM_21060 [Mycobacterium intracellulare subsp. yongonense 05-1390]|nr:hypothetical protein OEM_21060 [Mycobacterium intracellulare subsp. yongonense 05-1390]ARR77748.1 hypothetical protein MOTT12_02084 [Mycobacterium intracellulare subsp. yongonense]
MGRPAQAQYGCAGRRLDLAGGAGLGRSIGVIAASPLNTLHRV